MVSVHDRPFRFSVCVFSPANRDQWVEKAKKAEELGYDIISLSDHLGTFSPVPTLTVVAEATERIRVGIYVSSSTLYHPKVLARDYATVDRYSGGRVEIGLGAGYSRAEFENAGLPWRPAGERVTRLEETVREFRRLLADPAFQPQFEQSSGPPIVIAGRGDRVLRLAAKYADVIGFSGTAPVPDGEPLKLADLAEIEQRVAYVRAVVGDRVNEVEFGIPVHRVLPPGTVSGLTDVWQNPVDFGAEELAAHPSFLIGTPEENADKLRTLRRKFGFSYFTVMESEMDSFAKVIEVLR